MHANVKTNGEPLQSTGKALERAQFAISQKKSDVNWQNKLSNWFEVVKSCACN